MFKAVLTNKMLLLQERGLIYPGASLTKEESRLLIMSYLIRHNLTDIALEDLLELINCHVPVGQSIYPSKYKFVKQFPSIATIKTHYYCPDCKIPLDMGDNLSNIVCGSCRETFMLNSLQRNGCYFIYLPLKSQLSNLLSSPLFYQLKRDCPDPNVLSDVSSGVVYKSLRKKGIISNVDITIQWNADGFQTFKSSKISMCPLQVMINELNYRQRKEHILLAGLWASVGKPNLDIFLKPFVHELQDLHENGFECFPPGLEHPVIIKVHTILAPVDSVERCALQNMHQFNGSHGCSMCLHPGVTVEVGNGFSRVYPGGTEPMRSDDQHERDAFQAEREKIVVNGVKGVSSVMLLPIFSIVKCFPPEYMHSVLLGVVKLFLSHWIETKHYQKSWYIGTKLNILNCRLAHILPPCEVTRTPQAFSNLKLWKASEYRHFLVYYSLPILKDILPAAFYKHWLLLVYAITMFNKNKILPRKFAEASEALQKFVHKTADLYGQEMMKFNVHLLLHIPSSVTSFGALWAWSAFPYEHNNFVLRKMLHNSPAILQQICKSYLRFQTVKRDATFSNINCSRQGKKLYSKLMDCYQSKQSGRRTTDNQLIIFGNGKIVRLTLIEKLLVQARLQEEVEDSGLFYEKFIFDHIVFHAITYEKMVKRNNSIIETTFGAFMEITGLCCINTTLNRNSKYVILGKRLDVCNNANICSNSNICLPTFCHEVTETNGMDAVLPQNVASKCVLIPCNGHLYVSRIVNTMETD